VAIPLTLFVLVVSLLPGLASTRVQITTGVASAFVLVVAAALSVPSIELSLVIPLQLILLTVIGRASPAGADTGSGAPKPARSPSN
jgi:hypothetical protein